MNKRKLMICCCALTIVASPVTIAQYPAFAAQAADTAVSRSTVTNPDGSVIQVIKDLPYVKDGVEAQKLDLFLPQRKTGPLPVVVFFHGGGWSGGDKRDADGPALAFARQGYAAASVNYRLAGQKARWPAQLLDCKSAVRWLRANSAAYGFDPKRFIAAGHSAGAHLAAMIGVTSGLQRFDAGDNLDVSSDVQAVVWCSGVSDMIAISSTPGYDIWLSPTSGAAAMLGDPPLSVPQIAADASPVTYTSKKSVPFIIFHGDADPLVPYSQAVEMFSALIRNDVTAELHLVKGAGHDGVPPTGGAGYFSPNFFTFTNRFLAKALDIAPDSLGNSYEKPDLSGASFVTEDYPPSAIERFQTGAAYAGHLSGLGEPLELVPTTGESNASAVTVDGMPGFRTQKMPGIAPRFVYFNVGSKFRNGAAPDVILTLTYIDAGPDVIELLYDSNDPSVKGSNGPGSWKHLGSIRIDGTGKWRQAQFSAHDALFDHRLNGYDVRAQWNDDVEGTIGPAYVRVPGNGDH